MSEPDTTLTDSPEDAASEHSPPSPPQRAGLRIGLFCSVIFFAVLPATAWWIFMHRAGLTFTTDSCVFLSNALAMRQDHVFTCPVNRAPLYMLLLSAVLYVTSLPGVAASAVSGLCALVSLTCFHLLARRFTRSLVISALLCVVLCTWARVLYVWSMAWTEPLYITLSLLTLYCVVRHWESRKTGWFVAAAVCAACVPLFERSPMNAAFFRGRSLDSLSGPKLRIKRGGHIEPYDLFQCRLGDSL